MYPQSMEYSQTSLLVVESNHLLINVDVLLEESMEADVVAAIVALVPWAAAAKERRGMQCCNRGRVLLVLDQH